MQQEGHLHLSIIWRGKKFVLEMNPSATLKDLGTELEKQTNVRADTMRLIVVTHKSSKMLYPFAEEHSSLSLEAASILEGKAIRMMGVHQDEVDEVIQNSKVDLRIAGFDEEENRMRNKMLRGQQRLQVPRGTYIFCDFRTLDIPGMELNPPASEALKLMHRLAADPGIVAIMNKHRWRVGIMTELAPVGYVGVSPKCILGFNKNHGEEISLRLRTDDLRGFRKYESIKKTLLHELAHMVHSEHDANFYALDKQLNEEAAALDWTKSRSQTLSGAKNSRSDEEGWDIDNSASLSRKLGGQASVSTSARASSVAAAYHRLASTSVHLPEEATTEKSDPDDRGFNEFDHAADLGRNEFNIVNTEIPENQNHVLKLDNPGWNRNLNEFEPDPDDRLSSETMIAEPKVESGASGITPEPDPDDSLSNEARRHKPNKDSGDIRSTQEPDPDDCEMKSTFLENELGEGAEPDISGFSFKHRASVGQHSSRITLDTEDLALPDTTILKPRPNDLQAEHNDMEYKLLVTSDEVCNQLDTTSGESDLHDPEDMVVQAKAEGEDMMHSMEKSETQHLDDPVLDDQELQRIQDPVSIVCSRLQKAIEMLGSEVNNPTDTKRVLQTLLKIVRNIIDHPDEVKFKRLRKANPVIQRDILKYRAASEIISLTGYTEDVIFDQLGKAEPYFVLKHHDPGRLWLTKSSLEAHIAE